MVEGRKIPVITLLFFVALAVFAQLPGADPSTLPRDILRPQYGEEPRFPKDYVIGKLGRGDASEESYQAAKRIMASLVSGDGRTSLVLFPERKRRAVLDALTALGSRAWRIGGGRNEPDGSVSFLIRFLGREKSITGELYLRYETAAPAEPAGGGSGGAESGGAESGGAGNGGDATAAENPEAGQKAAAQTAAQAVAEPAETGQETSAQAAAQADAQAVAESAGAAVSGESSVGKGAYWRVDDVLLEPPSSLAEGKFSPGGADMTPYERFF
jgi:hypothetical protein